MVVTALRSFARGRLLPACAVGAGLLVVAAGRAPLRAQQPDDAAQLAVVRERYAAIQAAHLDSTALRYLHPGGDGTVTLFRTGATVRKMVVTFDGDGASGRTEYFFHADTLQFVWHRWTRFPDAGPDEVSEDRWYFAGGRLFRWQATDEDGSRHLVDRGDRRFEPTGTALTEAASCWREYVAEGEVAERVC